MFVIGLTGGIASGKSTVTEMLQAKGAAILNADRVGHEAYRPGTDVWKAVVDAFGQEVVGEGGEINRRRLGEIVFSDPEKLKLLNSITHPRMKEMMRVMLDELRSNNTDVAVLEAALLIEANWKDLADEVWLTVAPEETAMERLINRNGFTPEQAQARIRSQLSNEERLKHADVVIDTNCTLEEVGRKVDELWEALMRRLSLPAGSQ